MASPGNPFASLAAPAAGSGNPFDPLGSPAPAVAPSGMSAGVGLPATPTAPMPQQQYPPQQQQYAQQVPPPQQPSGQGYGQQQPSHPGLQMQQQPLQQQPHQGQQDPWNGQQTPSKQAVQQAQEQVQNLPGSMQGYQQQPSPAPVTSPAGSYDPFSQSSASNQLVVSQQQSNPYANVVAPSPSPATQSYGVQALVPAAQQQSQWGLQPGQAPHANPAPTTASGGAGGFDPFAAPPAAPPAPPPPPAPAPAQVQDQNPFAVENNAYPQNQPNSPAVEPTPAPPASPPAQVEQQLVVSQQQQEPYLSSRNIPARDLPADTQDPNARALVPAPASGPVQNKYAKELARQAPPGASPLPKAELVKKKGFVLSRISFRTIVMKKWKQSYWVQYGSHTMLWFRSQGDFDDWLNNPYHTQVQRNFLIKLAVNFVHDLYKPNVRGYQVTQCRVKPYGTKMVRQFKLERWMDYGPTIAAAFGSYDPKEVDALREAIVECMRNTPLDGGIRATGAVRQDNPESQQRIHPESMRGGEPEADYPAHLAGNGQNFNSNASASAQTLQPASASRIPAASRSVVSANDLLDDHNNFDDTVSLPGGRSSALVPAQNFNQSYPGAPPTPHQQPSYATPQQQAYQQQPQQQAHQQPQQQAYQQPPHQQQAYQQPSPQQQAYQQAPPQQAYDQPPQAQHYQQFMQQQHQQPPPQQAYGYQQ